MKRKILKEKKKSSIMDYKKNRWKETEWIIKEKKKCSILWIIKRIVKKKLNGL